VYDKATTYTCFAQEPAILQRDASFPQCTKFVGCYIKAPRAGSRSGPAWMGDARSGASWWAADGEPLVAKSPELGLIPTWPPTFHGWGPRPFGNVSQQCAAACLGGGLGKRSSGCLRCSDPGA
jgi:hypothetical protein